MCGSVQVAVMRVRCGGEGTIAQVVVCDSGVMGT